MNESEKRVLDDIRARIAKKGEMNKSVDRVLKDIEMRLRTGQVNRHWENERSE